MIDALLTAGRVTLGLMFIAGGLRHLESMPHLAQAMERSGRPLPWPALTAGIIFQILVGACLVVGVGAGTATLVLALFTVATSILMLCLGWIEEPDWTGEPRKARNGLTLSCALALGTTSAWL